MRISELPGRVDFPELRRQKQVLLETIASSQPGGAQETGLTGILHFIDAFQDACAEDIGEAAVFGKAAADEN